MPRMGLVPGALVVAGQYGWVLLALAVLGSLAEDIYHLRQSWAAREGDLAAFAQELQVREQIDC